jgi:hypothetical protein
MSLFIKLGEPRNIEITTEGYNTGGTVAVKTQRRQKLQVESGSIATNPDVVVTVDNSGSIDDEGVLQCEKNAVNAFIDSPELGLSANGTHVAFHRYRSYAQIRQGLTDDTAALHSAVNTLPTSSGGSSGTNLQAGLKLAQYELTNGNNTDRVDTGANGHPDVLIIVGDGDPTISPCSWSCDRTNIYHKSEIHLIHISMKIAVMVVHVQLHVLLQFEQKLFKRLQISKALVVKFILLVLVHKIMPKVIMVMTICNQFQAVADISIKWTIIVPLMWPSKVLVRKSLKSLNNRLRFVY